MKFQNHEWMEQLNEEFPEVEMFGPQCISAGVGKGWVQLLRPILQALKENNCKASQIKQKFGGLRFYWRFPQHIEEANEEWRNSKTDKSYRIVEGGGFEYLTPRKFEDEMKRLSSIIEPLIYEAERLSYATCETCGNSINPPRSSGYRTECDECKKSPSGRWGRSQG